MNTLKLEWLHAFAKVLELGAFSRAATYLHVTQPAVSLQMRRLETALGVRLLERVGRRVTPTAAGLELLGHVRRIEEEVAAAMHCMARHVGGDLGRVRIGTGATACIYLLPPLLQTLKQRLPSLEIMVRTGNTVDVLRDLEDNALDVGLVTLPAPGRMFSVTPLLEDDFVAIAARRDNPMGEVVTPQDLAQLPLVLFEAGGHTRSIVDRWFEQAGISPTPVMSLGNVEAIKELVGAGLGCAVLPGMAVRATGGDGPLVVRPLTPRLHRQLGLVLRRDKILDRGLRETVKALRSLAR